VCSFAAYIYKEVTFVPEYRTNVTYAVKSRESGSNPYNNLVQMQNLASVYETVLHSDELSRIILDRTGWDRIPGELTTKIIDGTNIIEIRTTAPDPRSSFLYLKYICECYPVILDRVANEATLTLLSPARVPLVCSNESGASSFAKEIFVYALVISCLIFAYLSLSKKVINSSAQLSSKINAPLIESLPNEGGSGGLRGWIKRKAKKQKNAVLLGASSNAYVEAIYNVRAKILSSANRTGYSVVITSTLANEGKSTVSASVASSIVKTGKKVALVDLDIYNSSQNLFFNNPDGYNRLSTFLSRTELTVDDISFDKNGLAVFFDVGVGKKYKEFPINQVKRLINNLKKTVDFIIIDTPPVSIFADAAEICECANASALVVREHYATEEEISESVSTLNEGKAVLLGCIYNRELSTRRSRSGGYYGNYYYGKYYGNYKKFDEEGDTDE
ncbi:MAG: AAA family ATPase, partial [Firmicutes bacterium]|nr:AAA family ATPase [Candidatus Colimorpha enterica]